jgi:signal transduction histidine kinase
MQWSPITTRVSQSSFGVEISVHNFGNPILLEDQSGLFKLFRRSDTAELGAQKGWGIGLVLVKGLVLAQQGSIRLKSDPQTGTTFTVSLPLDSRNEKVENEN